MKGRARRRDVNEPAIIRALRGVGASVYQLDETGAPDLLVGWCSRTFLLEVKQPLGPLGGLPAYRDGEGGEGDLTMAQVKWFRAWKGAQPILVRGISDALAAIGAIPPKRGQP